MRVGCLTPSLRWPHVGGLFTIVTYSFQGNWQMLGSRDPFPQNWLLNLHQDTAGYKKYRDTWTKFNIHCILDDILFILCTSGAIMNCWRNPIFIVPFFQLFSRLEIFRSKKICIYICGGKGKIWKHKISELEEMSKPFHLQIRKAGFTVSNNSPAVTDHRIQGRIWTQV